MDYSLFHGVTEIELGDNETSATRSVHNFDDLQLGEALLRGIYASGYEKPSAIQQRAILPCIRGRDVIVHAHAGSGKTTTFAIGVLSRVDVTVSDCQALVLAPTRDKALQIRNVIAMLGQYMDLTMYTCFGGTSLLEDIRWLETPYQIVVGTPGRIWDLVSRGSFSTMHIKTIILSQADEMMSLGLKPRIDYIFKTLPETVQVIISSATVAQDVQVARKAYMQNPMAVVVKRDQLSLERVRQFYVNVLKEKHKLLALCDLYDTVSISQAVIFCNSNSRVNRLAYLMTLNHFTVATISDCMEIREREKIIEHFRRGSYRVLITTDLAARDIDVRQPSVVINFDLPLAKEDYIYRVGSGRGGLKDVAINIVTDCDLVNLREIEEFYNTTITEMPDNIASTF